VSDTDGIQDLVDALAERLQRSVAIDDPQIRLIAASRHFGDEDAVRVQFLLGRKSTEGVTNWLLSLGLDQVDTWYRLPANAEWGTRARLCVPIRYAKVLLGYLWLIDDNQLTPDETADAVATAEAVAPILYRRDLAVERRRTQIEGILRELLSSDAAARAWAATELIEEGLVSPKACVAALVVRPAQEFAPDEEHAQERLQRAFADAASKSSASAADGAILSLAQRHRLVLIATGERTTGLQSMRSLAETVLETVAAASGQHCLAGIGTPQEGLEAAVRSFTQAVAACRAARHLPGLGPAVAWQEMGIYAMLIKFAPETPDLIDFPAQLLTLSGRKNSEVLLRTAETYLDNAGDTQATAQELHIHRATLYQRLERISKLSGLDMGSGADRLMLHLGIKLAHVTGAYPRLVATPIESER